MSVLSVLSWKSSQGWSIQTEKATYFNTFPSAFKLRITKQTMMETIMVHVWWPRNINDERRRVSRLCLSPPRAWTAPRPIPETNAKDTNDEYECTECECECSPEFLNFRLHHLSDSSDSDSSRLQGLLLHLGCLKSRNPQNSFKTTSLLGLSIYRFILMS